MTIYIDIIFLENLGMNYIILLAVSILFKIKNNKIKCFISSFIGSLYAIISMMNIFPLYSNIIFKIILSLVMIYIAFKPKSLKQLIKETIIFYLISFTFGGIAFFLLYFIKPQDILMKNGVFIGEYPIKIAILCAIFGFAIISVSYKIIKNKINKNNLFCKIEIEFNKTSVKTTAMIDTGNLLKEPITGYSVIIIEKQILEQMIPKNILDNIDNIINGNINKEIENTKFISKFRIIPFMSLGKQNGLLLGFKPDKIKIINETETQETNEVIIRNL